LVKQKVEEVKNDNPLGISDYSWGYASTCQVFFLLMFQSMLSDMSKKCCLSAFIRSGREVTQSQHGKT